MEFTVLQTILPSFVLKVARLRRLSRKRCLYFKKFANIISSGLNGSHFNAACDKISFDYQWEQRRLFKHHRFYLANLLTILPYPHFEKSQRWQWDGNGINRYVVTALRMQLCFCNRLCVLLCPSHIERAKHPQKQQEHHSGRNNNRYNKMSSMKHM